MGETGAGGGLPTPQYRFSYSKTEISSHFRPEEVAACAARGAKPRVSVPMADADSRDEALYHTVSL